MEDFTATRPSAVIVLDLEAEADVLARVHGRRVDMATGWHPVPFGRGWTIFFVEIGLGPNGAGEHFRGYRDSGFWQCRPRLPIERLFCTLGFS